MELSDADIISSMMRRAEAEGLWTEVQRSFQDYLEEGDSVKEAAYSALYDWDC